jgi:hypothetical protein
MDEAIHRLQQAPASDQLRASMARATSGATSGSQGSEATIAGTARYKRPRVQIFEPRLHRHTSWGSFLLSPTMSAERPFKEDKCEIAETQLRLRARLESGRIAGYRPRPDPSQMAFRTCTPNIISDRKEAMSDIWRWPVAGSSFLPRPYCHFALQFVMAAWPG